jgi:hypothetical protein
MNIMKVWSEDLAISNILQIANFAQETILEMHAWERFQHTCRCDDCRRGFRQRRSLKGCTHDPYSRSRYHNYYASDQQWQFIQYTRTEIDSGLQSGRNSFKVRGDKLEVLTKLSNLVMDANAKILGVMESSSSSA